MSTSIRPDMDDADLWEYYVDQGLDPEEATLHVTRRRQAGHQEQFAGQELEEAQPDFSGVGGAIGAAALKAGQGATFGLSDEIAGLLGGDTEGARMAMGAAQQQRPIVSGAADLAGSLATPIPGMGTAAKAGGMAIRGGLGLAKSTLPGAIKAGATGGAMLGGLNAFGRSEGSVTDRLPNAVLGTVSGAALGAVLPAGLAFGKAAGRFVGKPAMEVVNRLRGGDTALGRTVLELKQTSRKLGLDLSDDDINNLAMKRLSEEQEMFRTTGRTGGMMHGGGPKTAPTTTPGVPAWEEQARAAMQKQGWDAQKIEETLRQESARRGGAGAENTATGTREAARVSGIENPVRAAPSSTGMEHTVGDLTSNPAPNVQRAPATTQSPGPKGTPIPQAKRPRKVRSTSQIAKDEVPTQAPATATGLEVGKTAEEATSATDRGLREGPFKKGPGRNPVPKQITEAASANRAKRYAGIGTGPNAEQSLTPKTQTMPSGQTFTGTLVRRPPARPYPKTPEEVAGAARASATVQQQMDQGLRGPRGGMGYSNKSTTAVPWKPTPSGPPNVNRLGEYPRDYLEEYAATGRNKNIARAIQEFLAAGER